MLKKIRETEYQGLKERSQRGSQRPRIRWMDGQMDLAIYLPAYLPTIRCGRIPQYQPKDQSKQQQQKRRHEGKEVSTEYLPLVRPCAECFHIRYGMK